MLRVCRCCDSILGLKHFPVSAGLISYPLPVLLPVYVQEPARPLGESKPGPPRLSSEGRICTLGRVSQVLRQTIVPKIPLPLRDFLVWYCHHVHPLQTFLLH